MESSTERKEEKHNIELWNGFYENMTIQDTAEHLRLLYPEYVEKTLKSFPDTEYLKENPNNDIYIISIMLNFFLKTIVQGIKS